MEEVKEEEKEEPEVEPDPTKEVQVMMDKCPRCNSRNFYTTEAHGLTCRKCNFRER